MKLKLLLICILFELLACSSQKNHADKNAEQATVSGAVVAKPCQLLSFTQMIDDSLWQELYKDNEIEVKSQLQRAEISELTRQEFEEHADYAAGAIGIPLGDVGDLDLDSEVASVKKDGLDYLIDLKEDNLSFRLAQNFDINTTLKFRENPDVGFEDLCTNSDPSIVQIAKFVLFKSASSMYLYNLKD
ncbi:hypothetical protein [Acinetobacter silvestris]|uniref:Uncharacterized protein n=1 Tax=Acinetobacter silvestris TaxID=1977882 RepID=A0A1Y3CFL5_9GAMM|nr:hypothetical protein [Acinetobacter silvestris]OTG65420.1 hypothetical protein B9T28_08090 [Acinetobacter silvestris]